jgi:NADH-quinone oxidoreductase subunit A
VSRYYLGYGVVALLGIFGVGFIGATFLIWRVLRPNHPTRQKLLAYECGIDAVGETWTQPHIRYYIFAFLFVVFDVESAFLFPWALVYRKLGMFAVVEMILFIGILFVGLVYAWGRKLLDWI